MISRYARCLLLVNPIVYHKSNLWGEESKTTDAYIKESSTYVKYFMPALCVLLYCVAVCNIVTVVPKIASRYSNSTHMSLFYGLLQYFSLRYIQGVPLIGPQLQHHFLIFPKFFEKRLGLQ